MQLKNTSKRNLRNVLRAHTDGTFSIRLNGRWTHHLPELSQSQYLALLRCDRERVVIAEYERSRSLVAGTKAIVTRRQVAA